MIKFPEQFYFTFDLFEAFWRYFCERDSLDRNNISLDAIECLEYSAESTLAYLFSKSLRL